MTTLESTLATIETLPDAELAQIVAFVRKLQRQRSSNATPKLTTKQLQKKLQRSIDDYKAGRYTDTDTALKNLRHKYGL